MSVSNALTQQVDGKPEVKPTFSRWLSGEKNQINLKNMLVSEKAVVRFTASITTAVSNNPALRECDFPSIVSAGLTANDLALSLSPSLGHVYLVPFNDRKNNRKVATFILGYRGYIQLAQRSGLFKKINVMEIKEGELVHYDPFEEEIVLQYISDAEERAARPTVGYYAMFELMTGFQKKIYWSKDEMLKHADRYSQAFSVNATTGKYPRVSFADYEAGKVPAGTEWLYSSYWYSNFDGMAKKTMIRQLLSKWAPMSLDMQVAYEQDSESMANTENVIELEPDNVTDADDFFSGAVEVVEEEPAPAKSKKGQGASKPEPTETKKEEGNADN